MAGTDSEERMRWVRAGGAFRRFGLPLTRKTGLVFVGSVLGYVLLSESLNDLLVIDGVMIVGLSDGLAIPLGILFGPPAAIGLGVGVPVTDLANGALSVESALVGGAHVVVASLASGGWRRFPRVLPPFMRSHRRLRVLTTFALVTVVASLIGASFLAWSHELFGTFPFYVTFTPTFIDYVVATAIVSPWIGYPLFRIERYVSSTSRRPARSLREDGPAKADWTIVGVSVVWALLGVVGSIGFDVRSRIPVRSFRRRGLVSVYEIVHPAVFGHDGRRAQVVFGTVMLLLLVVAIVRVVREEDRRWN